MLLSSPSLQPSFGGVWPHVGVTFQQPLLPCLQFGVLVSDNINRPYRLSIFRSVSVLIGRVACSFKDI